MNNLDQAFIRAYSKDVYAAEAERQGVAGASRHGWIGATSPTGAAPAVETSYANGTWYRIDPPPANAAAAMTTAAAAPSAAEPRSARAFRSGQTATETFRPGLIWRMDPAHERLAAPVMESPAHAESTPFADDVHANDVHEEKVEALSLPELVFTDRGRVPRTLYFDIVAGPVAEEDEAPKALIATADARFVGADLPEWVRQPPAHLFHRDWSDWSDAPLDDRKAFATIVEIASVDPRPEPAKPPASSGKGAGARAAADAALSMAVEQAYCVTIAGPASSALADHAAAQPIAVGVSSSTAAHASLAFEQTIGEGVPGTGLAEPSTETSAAPAMKAPVAKPKETFEKPTEASPAPKSEVQTKEATSAETAVSKPAAPARSSPKPLTKEAPGAAANVKEGKKSETKKPKSEPAKPAPAVASETPKTTLTPAWEVDRFRWPAVCEELLDAAKDHFHQVASAALESAKSGRKVLAITGCHRGEGRTTLAICLARAAAKCGAHVALVDADFDHPRLAADLHIEGVQGWEDAILGRSPLGEAAICSLLDRLTVIPLLNEDRAAEAASHGAKIAELLRQASQTHDLVVVDMGPTPTSGPRPAQRTSGGSLAAALVVRDSRRTSDHQITEVTSRLAAIGVEAIGIIETFLSYSAPVPAAASA